MIERRVDLQTGDGTLPTFLFHPEHDGPHPVVLYLMDAPGIRPALRDMASRLGDAAVFIGPSPTESMRRFLGRHKFEPIRDIPTAERVLGLVVEQGEGGSSDSADSHFHRFSTMLEEYEALKRDGPAFEPAFPVLANPFTRTPPEYSAESGAEPRRLLTTMANLLTDPAIPDDIAAAAGTALYRYFA